MQVERIESVPCNIINGWKVKGMLGKGEILDGKYEVIRALGQGGMSTVYLCKNNKLGNLWAVKEVSEEVKEYMDLKAEADILKNLCHPGIPRIVDIFYKGGNLYIVEDYIEGETLENRLKREGKLSFEEIREIGVSLCNIIEYLHSFNPPIIYRDLKPSNIMLTPSGGVVLIDFGISRRYKAGRARDTVLMGSKGYASPEQYGRGQSTKKTDIYGLGATMYHMAVGSAPASLTEPLKDKSYEGVDIGLKNIIQKAMQIDEEDRYESAAQLRDEIKGLSKKPEKTVLMTTEAPKTIVMNSSKVKEPIKKSKVPEASETGRKRVRRGRIASAVIALTLVLAAMQQLLWNGGVKTLGASKKDAAADGGAKAETTQEAVEKVEKAEQPSKPALTEESDEPLAEEFFVKGEVDRDEASTFQLDEKDNNGKGKAKGKSKNKGKKDDSSEGVLYRLSPYAEAGRFENNFIMRLQYLGRKDDYLIVYCTAQNNTGTSLVISYNDTRIYDDRGEYEKAYVFESSPDTVVAPDSKEHSIVFVFDNFDMDTDEITLKSAVESKEPSYSDTIILKADIKN